MPHPEEGGTPPEKNSATAQPSAECTLANFALLLQLPLDFLQQVGVTETYVSGRRVLRVVCRDEEGSPGAVLFQIALNGEQRYQWRRGDRPMPYGSDHLQKARDQGRIVLVRHLSDALALRRIGLPALALLDADRRLDELTSRLREIPALYLLAEETNQPTLSRWIARSGLSASVQILSLAGEGLTATYARAPEQFLTTINAALASALSWERSAAMRRAEERERAWALCAPLACQERLLDRFAEALQQAGFAGDPRPAQTLFLSLTSRLLDLPVSLVLKGPSAGGKSFLLKTVLAYFPRRAYHETSSLSPKALAYLQQPLTHRMLVVAEYDGVQEPRVEYLLRTLLSEGRIVYDVPVNSGGRWVTMHMEVEGPTGLLLTTTRLRLHPENETRMHSLEITDTAAQTRAILNAQAQGAQHGAASAATEDTPWHALQVWLEHSDASVVIPYAEQLAARMPVHNAVRLRRDFPRVLQMIKAHALLHQATRERDAAHRIVATLEDYAVVYDLMAVPMAVEVEATVSAELRETVHAVVRLFADGKPVSGTALVRELGLDKSSVSRRVGKAIEAGYLHNRETRKGLQARLVPGEELPGTQDLLPPPDSLETS